MIELPKISKILRTILGRILKLSLCFDQLNQYMPARTIRYPWTLIYSTEQHGFSLKTLYRDMQGVDSPVMLVVKDTNKNASITTAVLKYSHW